MPSCGPRVRIQKAHMRKAGLFFKSVGRTLVAASWLLVQGGLLAQSTVSVRDGVYSKAQAADGKADYEKLCVSCHGEDLQGGDQNPPLIGDDFLANWEGQTMAELFNSVQTMMPADHPGTLTKEQTARLLAYILSANKFPDGMSDLPQDASSLKQIQIEKPKP